MSVIKRFYCSPKLCSIAVEVVACLCTWCTNIAYYTPATHTVIVQWLIQYYRGGNSTSRSYSPTVVSPSWRQTTSASRTLQPWSHNGDHSSTTHSSTLPVWLLGPPTSLTLPCTEHGTPTIPPRVIDRWIGQK